jgi:hypothetical protein
MEYTRIEPKGPVKPIPGKEMIMKSTTGISLNEDAAELIRLLSYRLSVKRGKRVSLSETVKIAVDAVTSSLESQDEQSAYDVVKAP